MKKSERQKHCLKTEKYVEEAETEVVKLEKNLNTS